MAEIIPTTLSQFYEVEKSLIADLLDNKLTFSEARVRYKLMCEFIPNNVEINPVELDVLMKLRFKDDPNWKKQERIYKIDANKEALINIANALELAIDICKDEIAEYKIILKQIIGEIA